MASIKYIADPQHKDGNWWEDSIICGDSLAVMGLMAPESVHLAITSPPYNVGLEYDGHKDAMSYGDYLKWITPFLSEIQRVLVNGGRFALNVAPTSIKDFKPLHYDLAAILRGMGMIMRTEIIWYKQTIKSRTAWGSFRSPRNPHILPSWEYVLVFSKGSWTLDGDKEEADISNGEFVEFSDGFWQIRPESRRRQTFEKGLAGAGKDDHPAPFPEELVYRLVKYYSYRGNVVLDPFAGTGTVAVVGAKTGRKVVGIEQSDRY